MTRPSQAPASAGFDDVIIIDFEASSLPGDFSYPMELGLAWVASGRTESIPIRPIQKWLSGWIWDPAAEALHGWSREELLRVGLPTDDAVQNFEQLTAGYTLYSDNPAAETGWLDTLYEAARPSWLGPSGRRHRIYNVENLSMAALQHRGPANFHEAYLAAEQAAVLALPRYHRADQDAGRWAALVRHILHAAQ